MNDIQAKFNHAFFAFIKHHSDSNFKNLKELERQGGKYHLIPFDDGSANALQYAAQHATPTQFSKIVDRIREQSVDALEHIFPAHDANAQGKTTLDILTHGIEQNIIDADIREGYLKKLIVLIQKMEIPQNRICRDANGDVLPYAEEIEKGLRAVKMDWLANIVKTERGGIGVRPTGHKFH